MEWDPSLSVGIASVDADHQFILSLLSELHNRLISNEPAFFGGLLLNMSGLFSSLNPGWPTHVLGDAVG